MNIYENINKQNPNKKRNMLIVFDDMIADMLNNKKLLPIVTEVGTKTFLSFSIQSYFAVPKKLLN